jgi:Cu+-exporting ATPase
MTMTVIESSHGESTPSKSGGVKKRKPVPNPGTAGQTTLTIPVLGMSCAACQSHVERALRQTPGVGVAEVNLMTHSARVVFDPSVAAPESLVEAVRNSGYESSLPIANDESEDGSVSTFHETEHDAEAEAAPLRHRALAALALAAAAMALSMPLMREMRSHPGFLSSLPMRLAPGLYRVPERALEFALLVLTIVGMRLAASEVYRPAWKALLHRATNMNTLVALGTISALLYSAAATFAPAIFLDRGLRPEVYYESVLFILAFLLLGRWLEARAKTQTQGALRAFAQLRPRTARVIQHGREAEIPLASVQIQDTVVLRPGERVPVDGVVLSGTSSVDESLLTGESLPAPRGPGDRLIGGSLNYDGALEYRATAVAAGGVLGQMLSLMQEAQASRAPTQKLADRASAIFVPVVLGIAALTLLAWLALDHGNFGHAFAAAVTVLVIACPCAMGLAVPAALTVAIGRGAQLGILLKSGEALEALAGVDTVVLDKTGTLTEGKPRLDGVHLATKTGNAGTRDAANQPSEKAEMLALAAAVERRSEHPLARAVLDRAERDGLPARTATEVRAVPGKGIVGIVDGHAVAAGNAALFAELGIAPPAALPDDQGCSVLLIAIDRQYRGYVTARDEIRPGAAEAVALLRKRGLRTIMLTGDSAASASAIAKQCGVDEFHAGLLPEQKLERIRALQAAGRKVAMVGDGINDAAALAQADAGIAMGTGTDLAREAGDAVLLRGEPLSIVAALDLARATLRTMRANLGWAVGYNALGIPVAAGVLYPMLGVLLTPAIASAAMALSSVSVLANSLRLRGFHPKSKG